MREAWTGCGALGHKHHADGARGMHGLLPTMHACWHGLFLSAPAHAACARGGCAWLQLLEVSANALSSLEGLSGCISLRSLHAPGNRLSGAALKGLARCTALQVGTRSAGGCLSACHVARGVC